MNNELRAEVLAISPPPVLHRRQRSRAFDFTTLREFDKEERVLIDAFRSVDTDQNRPLYLWLKFLRLRELQLGGTCKPHKDLKRRRDEDRDPNPMSVKRAALRA